MYEHYLASSLLFGVLDIFIMFWQLIEIWKEHADVFSRERLAAVLLWQLEKLFLHALC